MQRSKGGARIMQEGWKREKENGIRPMTSSTKRGAEKTHKHLEMEKQFQEMSVRINRQ